MLLTTLAIGGTILAATTIAGLLMVYQISQATDIANSTKAIFAADAGTEWGLCGVWSGVPQPSGQSATGWCDVAGDASAAMLGNGAGVSVSCYDASQSSGGAPFDCEQWQAQKPSAIVIRSIGFVPLGTVASTSRIFDVTISAPPLPKK